MKKKYQSPFLTRQYMLSKDFELYYYSDTSLGKVSKHSHDYYEFYFFLEGDVSIEIEDRLYPVKYGDIMMIPPHVIHRPIIHSFKKPYQRFVFWISQEYCSYLTELSTDYAYLMQYIIHNKEYVFHNERIAFHALQSKLLRLLEEMHSDRFGKSPQITLCVNDLVLHLNRLVYEQKHQKKAAEELSLYQNLCSFIEEHIEEDLSLERLSLEFFVNKYHIAHVFKENLGISIHQYITKKRLKLCREAIISGMSITEAYQACGFGDYSSFYRAFKKEYGISPKDFRNMHPSPCKSSGKKSDT